MSALYVVIVVLVQSVANNNKPNMRLIFKGFSLTLLFLASALGAPSTIDPSSTTPSWVTVPNVDPKEGTIEKESQNQEVTPKIPKIYSMKVDTNVTNRFATTLVTSKVKNLDEKAQEATFAVVLPETAYISGFVMEIDGKKYEAYVKEKEEAKKTYDNAVSVGTAAGLVEVNARDSNRFTVSVNIEPQSKATFYLTYEELLARQNGQYEIVINLHPGQPVKDLGVQVNINETRPLKFVKAPSLRSGNEISKNDEKLDPKAVIENIANNRAVVSFKPDVERQKELAKNLGKKEADGLAGQFVVQYDVERDPQGGEILVSDGYFVHFFAPSDLKPLSKHVIFVLDTSGSMYGTRILQLKEAMKTILDQLKKEDTFNIIDFNSDINVWDIPGEKIQYQEVEQNYWDDPSKQNKSEQSLPGSFEANSENIKKAKNVVQKLEATGGTNIFSALEIALNLLKDNKNKDTRQPIIMFLTDGDPTSGETNTKTIVSKITEKNSGKIPIFSLSFGDGADRSFLEKLSLRNQAFARHIYEGADAALQLESFYKYISSPLLNKVAFKYVTERVSQVTKTNFPIFFDGSELVVAGRYPTHESAAVPSVVDNTPIDPGFAPVVNCYALPGPIELKPKFENPIGSLEKHWAYLTLKQILEDRDAADNKTELTKKALDIALKYSFVTPVSSLVVVKPNDTKTESNPEDASKSSNGPPGAAGYGPTLSFARPMSIYPNAGSVASYEAVHLVGQDLYDAMPQFASTPYLLLTTEVTTNVFEKLKTHLPWLVDIFNTENGTLTLPQGQFKLDSPTSLPNAPECPRTPLNQTGTCVLLKDCHQVYNLLTDLPTYSKFFCPLQEFAGVCCPTGTTT
ncbi:hypothetical protein WA026_010588 [Henosepilachna vigintioctopunctata]|uniref:Inter-alpha-trypsin inhibitor heavy chain H4-like n=1 Tax=Henosepilachna vigintioctopunctata TaxID=420089 RepID=A0AAW1VCN0_9CUCU